MRKVSFVIFAISLLAFVEQSAAACQCPSLVGENTREVLKKRYLEDSDYAFFIGKVLKLEKVRVPEMDNDRFLRVKVKVEKYWKGIKSAEGIIYTSYGAGSCGVRHVEGRSYMVIAHLNTGKWWTSSCISIIDVNDAEFKKFLDDNKKAETFLLNPRRGITTH